MRILLHICCAHCLEQTLAGLRNEFGDALDVVGYWFNPNIHPLLEYRRRLKAVRVLNEALQLPIHYEEAYGLESFLYEIFQDGKANRCSRCYRYRLNATARKAADLDIDVFSSTLIVSQQQDHRSIRQEAAHASEAWAVEFLYRDLREIAATIPRRKGIYAQQYCGCIFSEETRYRDTGKDLYRGPGG